MATDSQVQWIDRFDADAADAMLAMSNHIGGLPRYLGIQLEAIGPGTIEASASLGEELLTPSGNVHGGCLASILDHVTGAVIYPLMPHGYWGATTELKLNYIRPVQAGTVQATASVLAMTNRSAVVRGEIIDAGRVACAAQGTITIVAPRS